VKILLFFGALLCLAEPPLVLDPDTQISLRTGFDAERLYTVPASQGSWVAMAFDPKGRLIVSDQDSKGVFRVTLPDEASPIAVESLKGFPYEPVPWGKRTVGGALGFLHAFDSLYMVTMKGFYRCRDTDGDDHYDQFELLKRLQMGYEHSAHSVIKSEDGKALYLISGNYGTLPAGIPSRQPPVWAKDSLLPAMPDAMGHATHIKAPGGWICRISPDGKDWEMIASGFRNAVDMAINREGELFTYDSDLEFDIGAPWYRPTRVNHVVSAGEYGWRTGTAKWPEYFADSLGAVLNVGPGSPTGISFGHHSSFAPTYWDKLFLCDWTFGTIYTVDMEEDGASYTGTKSEFLSGTPLNISAMRFGPDGHMYFLIGGRNTASALYRVRYVGPNKTGPFKTLTAQQPLRDLRRTLETYHGASGTNRPRQDHLDAVEFAWPYLSHGDRHIRYAARVAIENQRLLHWQERFLAATNPRALIQGAIAICRTPEPGQQLSGGGVLDRLNRLPVGELNTDDRLALLRAYSLCFIRLSKPTTDQAAAVIQKLDPLYPSDDDRLNTELCRVLAYLNAPSVVAKTMALMKTTETKAMAYDKAMLARHDYGKEILKTMANTPNVQNIQYAYSLRRVQQGWTLESRKAFFVWLKETLSKSGGKSFAGSIRAIRQDAIDHLPAQDAASISWLLGDIAALDLTALPVPQGPGVAWTVDSATALFEGGLRGRDYGKGKTMFAAGRCVACHRFQGSGGYSGPDLGSVAQRYSIRDILQAIIEPSHSISEQYQASVLTLDDGTSLYGRVIYQNDAEVALAQNPFNFGDISKIPIAKVKSRAPSQLSMMPPGTIFPMNADELKNLLAYLISAGDRRHEVFSPKDR
jgi:putative heme-binding domain-containing protein